ncbi:hypothetical protein T440DRAFT_522323 [Plenodomus tracheiphilus IPT5]|uniref:Uncharacterized protein n=1 Tax=Plenodomus tracheiphilus IPT5 TaxID=1408161 RepID=A0A6A7ATP6_9PLEO|nr:hypothetical protein T440DRAFT_522323 [Plenodomus tracheiphilus IPT5]
MALTIARDYGEKTTDEEKRRAALVYEMISAVAGIHTIMSEATVTHIISNQPRLKDLMKQFTYLDELQDEAVKKKATMELILSLVVGLALIAGSLVTTLTRASKPLAKPGNKLLNKLPNNKQGKPRTWKSPKEMELTPGSIDNIDKWTGLLVGGFIGVQGISKAIVEVKHGDDE